jgi:glycosyltransferase involved in cell wall biosynthesis
LPIRMPDGSPWPRISIITPSYNQAQFIEETIRSVLLQGYPELEYIIIDGSSTDSSVEIIKKYEPWLTYWISEKDKGQTYAINKGFARATGEIIAWINSDDYYMPNIFFQIAIAMKNVEWVTGGTKHIDLTGRIFEITPANGPELKKFNNCFKNQNDFDFKVAQPSHFWSRKIINQVGKPNEKLHFCMDFEWMLRALALGHHPLLINDVISCIRYHPEAKTNRLNYEFDFERARILFYLSFFGILSLLPSLRHGLFYYARGLRSISDKYFEEGKRFRSFIIVLSAWLLTSKKVGGDFLSRLKRVLK